MTDKAVNSKSYKSFKNFSAALVKAFCTSIFGFIITPIVIGYVGDETYGIYKLIFDWLSNVWMFDLGISGAFLAISAAYVKKKELADVFADGFRLHVFILPLLFVASCAFYFLILAIADLDKVTVTEYSAAFWIVASTFIFFPFNIFRQYFEISERSSFISAVTIIQLFFTNLGILIFSYLGFGLIGLSLAYAICIIAGYIYIYTKSHKEMGWSLKSLLAGRGIFTKELRSSGRSYLSINISQKISFLADNTIIAYFFSASSVVVFFIAQRLGSLFQSQIQSLGFSSWASLIDFYHQKKLDLFQLRLVEVLKFNLFIAVLASIINYLFNKRFITLWIGEKYYVDSYFNIIISALVVVNILNLLVGHILSGTGHIQAQSRPYITLGVLNLIFSIVLTKFMGLHGPIFSSLITMGVLLIFKLYLIVSKFGVSKLKIIEIILRFSILIALVILVEPYFQQFYENSWISLTLWILIVSCLYFFFGFFWIFNCDERLVWYRRVGLIYRSLLRKSE